MKSKFIAQCFLTFFGLRHPYLELQLLAAPLAPARGTPVGNHCYIDITLLFVITWADKSSASCFLLAAVSSYINVKNTIFSIYIFLS